MYERGQTGSAATRRMGATAVALLAAGPRIMLAHVGDSRAYRLTRGGVLEQLTKDHSLVQRMVDAGMLTEAQAADHPDSSVLERAMGQGAARRGRGERVAAHARGRSACCARTACADMSAMTRSPP